MQPDPPPPALDWCLFLDVDGTLIELTDTPFETRASDGLKSSLASVADRLHGALALISGRSIEYLDKLFSPLKLPSAGLHGVERRTASGAMHGDAHDDTALDPTRITLADFVQRHAGTLLEDKGRTIAVHYRLAPQFQANALDCVTAAAESLGAAYHVQAGNMMLEIKPRDFSKGAAIHHFMREPPFCGRTPVFVGDDLTDLDGFRMVDTLGGISIGVGNRVRAKHHLADPAAVREWLAGSRLTPPDGSLR